MSHVAIKKNRKLSFIPCNKNKECKWGSCLSDHFHAHGLALKNWKANVFPASPWPCKNPTERDPLLPNGRIISLSEDFLSSFPFFFFSFLPFAVDFLLVWKQSCMHCHCGRSVLTETVVFVKFVVKKFTGEYIILKLMKWWYWLNLNKTAKINHEI